MSTGKTNDNKKIMVGSAAIYPIRSNVPIPENRVASSIRKPLLDRMLDLKVGQSFFSKNIKGSSIKSYCQQAREKVYAETGEKRTFISRKAVDKYPKGDVEGIRVWRKK